MSGHRPFDLLTKDFTPARREYIEKKKAELRADMRLHQVREACTMTQQALGKSMKKGQPAIAKLERRADVYVSSLRSYIEAMGGKLRIVAEFPDGEITITNFSDGPERA